ncbi:YozE family protein [Streptomyces sp. NPDC017943]|uniref:YozE family protein n=1 Tax=Streptomyces sp. NPDC017943 TaxID=3365019 RepID=UPI0037B93501
MGPVLAERCASRRRCYAQRSDLKKGRTAMQGFRRWLVQFEQAATPLGDLARLAAADRAWPDGPNRLPTYINYMERAGASTSALQALLDAWVLYAAEESGTTRTPRH